MKYILATLKEMALREAENQDPKLALGVGVMSNFGKTYACLIKNKHAPDEDIDAFLSRLISSGENRVSAVVCVTPEGEVVNPPKSLCFALECMNPDNRMGTQIFCPAEDGEAKTVYLSTLLRTL